MKQITVDPHKGWHFDQISFEKEIDVYSFINEELPKALVFFYGQCMTFSHMITSKGSGKTTCTVSPGEFPDAFLLPGYSGDKRKGDERKRESIRLIQIAVDTKIEKLRKKGRDTGFLGWWVLPDNRKECYGICEVGHIAYKDGEPWICVAAFATMIQSWCIPDGEWRSGGNRSSKDHYLMYFVPVYRGPKLLSL